MTPRAIANAIALTAALTVVAPMTAPRALAQQGEPDRRRERRHGERTTSAEQLRGLARDLDAVTTSARDRAERIAGSDRGPARDPVNDIRGFASRAHDLYTRIESPRAEAPTLQPVDTRGLKPLVETVREVGRQTERTARRSDVLRPVWSDLARANAILDRMARLF